MMSNTHSGCPGEHSEATNSTSVQISLVIQTKTQRKEESWEETPKNQKSLKKKAASKS